MFMKRVTELIDSHGITRNKLLTDIGLNKNSFVAWTKRGTVPGGDTLAKIADYFHVSTDYLLGRTDVPEGEGGSPIVSDEEAALDQELISRLVQLTPEEREKVDAFVQGLLASR